MDRVGWPSGNAPDLYSGGAQFESWPGLFRLWILVTPLPLQANSEAVPRLDPVCFVANPP
jgi:hypothetical protein